MARSRSEFEPIKIGWLGACLNGEGGGYDKIHRMAFVGDERHRRLSLARRAELHRGGRRIQLGQCDRGRTLRQSIAPTKVRS